MPLVFLGIILIGASYLVKRSQEPNVVVLPPVGPVIFNPAPPTGSNTFLGSITGIPGMYWNITNQIGDIPSGFVNPNATQSSTPMQTVMTTTPFSVGGKSVAVPISESYLNA
jgi:hypothetical protein